MCYFVSLALQPTPTTAPLAAYFNTLSRHTSSVSPSRSLVSMGISQLLELAMLPAVGGVHVVGGATLSAAAANTTPLALSATAGLDQRIRRKSSEPTLSQARQGAGSSSDHARADASPTVSGGWCLGWGGALQRCQQPTLVHEGRRTSGVKSIV